MNIIFHTRDGLHCREKVNWVTKDNIPDKIRRPCKTDINYLNEATINSNNYKLQDRTYTLMNINRVDDFILSLEYSEIM